MAVEVNPYDLNLFGKDGLLVGVAEQAGHTRGSALALEVDPPSVDSRHRYGRNHADNEQDDDELQ